MCGFNHNAHNILLDAALDEVVYRVLHFKHDWMHALLVHGVLNAVSFLMLEAMAANGVSNAWGPPEAYVATWTLPRRFGANSLHDMSRRSGRQRPGNQSI